MEVHELSARYEEDLEHFAREAKTLEASLEYHVLEDIPWADREHPRSLYGAYAAHGSGRVFLLSPLGLIKAKTAFDRIEEVARTVGIRYHWIPLKPEQNPTSQEMYGVAQSFLKKPAPIAAHR